MTLDLSKLYSTIGDVRKNLGAESESDTSFDRGIASFTPKEYVARWSAWHLGTGDWGRIMYELTHTADDAEIS